VKHDRFGSHAWWFTAGFLSALVLTCVFLAMTRPSVDLPPPPTREEIIPDSAFHIMVLDSVALGR
jgi:hypothetical protein